MTTVIRRVGDHEGGDLPERRDEDTNETSLQDRDTEWVVDLTSRRIIRRTTPVRRTRA